ncbi:sigma-54 interaction domain-containing protein [Flavobacterium geliluteum]|uniref:Sigma 54-interacting transcriptional regulator n=1 Tax=Flavobacterium geliluteum TaxID=2816120 RepID=A0A940X8F2_9FLAO|nr:sigma 54-interacting transcriptional regulator [Flavobacterium geliluteum]MBP4138390.1 sigma 54-interacting transcriptional regulator [Flavobacterium geliluteum]
MNNELNVNGKLIEQLPFEMIWIDYDSNIIYANAKFCENMGYSKEECRALTIPDINIAVTTETWKNHWEQINNKGCITFVATHKTKLGNFNTVQIIAQTFSNNGNVYICAIAYEIQESSFYKELMNNTQIIANIGGWELSLEDGSILATAGALNIFNTKNSLDLLPSKIIDKFKDDDKFKSLLGKVMRKAISFDEIFETNDSPPRFIRIIAKPILRGDKIQKVLGIYQDVTEIREKEKNLSLFKNIIDNVEDLIYVYNEKGDLLYYNKSLINKLGFSKKELDGMSIFDLDTMVTKDFYEAHFEIIEKKDSHRFEWLIERKNQTQFPVDIISSLLKYKDTSYICSVVRDITLKKQQENNLNNALEQIKSLKDRLENENEYLQEEISKKINFENIICTTNAYGKVLKQVNQVAPTETTVLITGESGTGKELLASAIHSNSRRKERPLIKVNCATLPKELIESELFGHKKGAFTGAIADKAGKFMLADGGTIFLDEIGEMPIDLQSKLLRVLQEGEFDTLGGMKTSKVDVRIIAATNRKLEEMIKVGTFREDLYYRLNVFPIYNIPLRDRIDDIPLLAHFFLDKYSSKAGKTFKRLSKKTIDLLREYHFPGNIRELENLIERAVITENGTTLNPGDWMPKSNIRSISEGFKTFEDYQRDYIIDVLNHTDWRVSGPNGAAKILNINDKTLFGTMKRLNIEKQVGLKSE